ncbi:MAG: T9SS type A sorting domain-containing protein [Bergeyella sp.]
MKKIAGLLFIFLAGLAFSQTGIKVIYYTGAEQNFAIQDSGKLYFSGDNLLIKTDASATDTSIPVSIISKIVFSSDSLAAQEVGANDKNLKLYPNPSSDFIRIKSDAKSLSVKIYSLDGKMVLSGNYKSDEDINVSKLEKGVYLVQANGTTIKFIKK